MSNNNAELMQAQNEMKVKKEKLVSQKQELNRQLTSSQKEVSKFKTENEGLKAEILELLEQNQKLLQKIGVVNNKLATVQNTSKKNMEELKSEQGISSERQSEIKDLQNLNSKYKKELDKAKKANRESEAELEQLSNQNQQLKDAMEDLMTKIADQRQMSTIQQDHANSMLVQTITNFDMKFKLLTRDFENQFHNKITAQQHQLDSLMGQVSGMRMQLEIKKQNIDMYKNQYQSTLKLIQDMRVQMDQQISEKLRLQDVINTLSQAGSISHIRNETSEFNENYQQESNQNYNSESDGADPADSNQNPSEQRPKTKHGRILSRQISKKQNLNNELTNEANEELESEKHYIGAEYSIDLEQRKRMNMLQADHCDETERQESSIHHHLNENSGSPTHEDHYSPSQASNFEDTQNMALLSRAMAENQSKQSKPNYDKENQQTSSLKIDNKVKSYLSMNSTPSETAFQTRFKKFQQVFNNEDIETDGHTSAAQSENEKEEETISDMILRDLGERPLAINVKSFGGDRRQTFGNNANDGGIRSGHVQI